MNQPTRHALYSEASGEGPLDITVKLLRYDLLADWRSERAPLLAKVTGGSFELGRTDLGPAEWRLSVRDGKTTDFEHDLARFIDMVINPVLMANWSNETHYVGVLTAARLWPLGVDPSVTGDVVVLDRVYDAPADPDSMLADSPRHAVASCGYELAGRDNALVALNGTHATSRD